MNISKINIWAAVMIFYSTQYYVLSKETWEKIKANEYPLKTYEYQSEDKALLGMERIPYSKYGNGTVGKPVILLSGLFATSIVWVSHSKSLGFLLSDAGFDVWLFNYRVTGLSRKVKDPKTGIVPKFSKVNWDYSFHEMGVYDLPAAIDLVLSVTGYSKVDVGGVSLGGTIPLITLAERPNYNEKVRNLLLMAPASRMASTLAGKQYYFYKMAIRRFLKPEYKKFRYVSLYRDPDHIPLAPFCKIKIPMLNFCVQAMNVIQGMYNPLHLDPVIDVFTSYPQPTSVKSIKHYFQLLVSGRFSNYDYGMIGNIEHYNTAIAPEYNVSKITAPAIVLYSKYDIMVPPQDIEWLLRNLPNVKDTLYIDSMPFSHQSFAMAKNSHLIVGPYIITQLTKDQS